MRPRAKRPESAAIVSTMRSPGRHLDAWVRWHAAIGIERFYLFFDADPSESDGERVARLPGVRVIVVDRRMRARMERDPYCADLLPLAGPPELPVASPEQLTARQLCNVKVALSMARREGIAWLLHIDADELFHPPKSDARAHFAAMDALGIGYAIYDNHEALCEAERYGEPFREVTLFRKNPRAVDPEALALVDPYFAARGGYFLAYANGKAAVRAVEGSAPAGVHGFHLPLQMGFGRCRLIEPSILHYPYTDFDGYWRKFERLGSYPGDVLLGRAWYPPLFELASRDLAVAGKKAEARRFYKRATVPGDARRIAAWLDAGLVARITAPSRFLAKA